MTSTNMECTRVHELLSDHLEGTLNEVLRGEAEAHLAGCADCRALREALVEVVETLRAFPDLEPSRNLVDRVVAATRELRQPRLAPVGVVIRPAIVIPSWMQAAAAGFAMVALGILLLVVGPNASARAATRLVDRTVSAGSALLERKDRLVEDVRLLGVVLSTAFEGRLEKVNERVEDYRRLLERRREEAGGDSKRGSQARPLPLRLASFRTAVDAGS
jgi:anti-sigma factor RsiW